MDIVTSVEILLLRIVHFYISISVCTMLFTKKTQFLSSVCLSFLPKKISKFDNSKDKKIIY